MESFTVRTEERLPVQFVTGTIDVHLDFKDEVEFSIISRQRPRA